MSAAPATATYVCDVEDLVSGTATRADVDGVVVAIVRCEDGEVLAVDDTCSHANVSLSEGDVDGCTLECWLHGSRFDLRTGEPIGPPATQPVVSYPVHVIDGAVHIDVTAAKEH